MKNSHLKGGPDLISAPPVRGLVCSHEMVESVTRFQSGVSPGSPKVINIEMESQTEGLCTNCISENLIESPASISFFFFFLLILNWRILLLNWRIILLFNSVNQP